MTKITNKEEHSRGQIGNNRTDHSDKTDSINSQRSVRINKTFRTGNDCRTKSSPRGVQTSKILKLRNLEQVMLKDIKLKTVTKQEEAELNQIECKV